MPHTTRTKTMTIEADIEPTPLDAGLTLTIRITAYDSGVIQVDGRPVDAGYVGALNLLGQKVEMLAREASPRRMVAVAEANREATR